MGLEPHIRIPLTQQKVQNSTGMVQVQSQLDALTLQLQEIAKSKEV